MGKGRHLPLEKQESLADAKVSARQQCVYEGPYSEEIYSKFPKLMMV